MTKSNSGFTRGRRSSGEWQAAQRAAPERGLHEQPAVFAAQMGVNLHQFSGTVPLWADTACAIFSNGTGAVTNQSGDFIYFN